ncbi:MAG: tetratricopeptide repeat protein, partial [Francisellaceae bacterium]|nr:tetratricopeptide repeat protein [Francisellaceae bacterium]
MLVKKSLQLLSLGALIFCVACGTAKKNRYQDNQSAIDKPDSLPFYMKKPDYKKAAELNVQLGYGYLKQKNYSRSKMKFIYALDLSPKSPEAHAGIAKYYHVVGEHDDAETHYLEAIKYSKRKAEDKHNYAIFLCDRHKVEQAKTQFIEAIDEKTYDGVAVSYQSLASCMQSHDRLEEAEKYYHAALRHDPYLSDTVLELSKITYAKK